MDSQREPTCSCVSVKIYSIQLVLQLFTATSDSGSYYGFAVASSPGSSPRAMLMRDHGGQRSRVTIARAEGLGTRLDSQRKPTRSCVAVKIVQAGSS